MQFAPKASVEGTSVWALHPTHTHSLQDIREERRWSFVPNMVWSAEIHSMFCVLCRRAVILSPCLGESTLADAGCVEHFRNLFFPSSFHLGGGLWLQHATPAQARTPAEFKHIIKRRKRNLQGFP
jgi:hypothetical protein